ncbi:MAG TPA: hypothetical protein VE758_01400 [Chthoniobacterales bacterium]|nr:hypothetical protein [Chthoniobacterales bacterium]
MALLVSIIIIFLVVVRVTHAGALWRDECAVVQLAQMPTMEDIGRNFQHEAFPPLFPLIVRAYMTVFGSSDAALRAFGFLVACLVITAFWINSRLFRNGPPLVGLALLSLNTTFLVWGTTIRGYGLGSALVVLMFGCVGSLLVITNRRRIIAALVVCLLGVQVLLYNSVLLIAIGLSAGAMFLARHYLKQALVILAICAAAAFSLLPYIPAYLRARDWNILVRGTPTAYSLWKHFEVALGNPGYSVPTVWYFIAVALAGVFIYRLCKSSRPENALSTHFLWYSTLVCGLSLAGCYSFLRLLSYTTSAWYYLALSCVIAAAVDLVASSLATKVWLRIIRVGFALVIGIGAPFANWSAITERQTNVDLAARTVAAHAAAHDLVVVVPWQFGIPFQRYYRGAAPWMTIPEIADHQVHRYDLMKVKMGSAHPIDDVAEAARSALRSGNRVWLVGGLNLPKPEEGPMILPPAPASRFKWDNRAYTAAWWQQLSVFVVVHSNTVAPAFLAQPDSLRINELEQTSLAVATGWR